MLRVPALCASCSYQCTAALATVSSGTYTLLQHRGAVCDFYLPEDVMKMIQLGETASIYLCCKIVLEVVILCYGTVIFCFFMSE